MPRNMSKVTQALEAKYEQLLQMAEENPEHVFPTLVRIIEPLVDQPNGVPSNTWFGNPKSKKAETAAGWKGSLKQTADAVDAADPDDPYFDATKVWQSRISQTILASQGLGVLKDIGPKGHLNRFESVEARQVASLISEDANSSYKLTRTQLRIKALVESVTGWTVVPLREII